MNSFRFIWSALCVATVSAALSVATAEAGDWSQWGGSAARNNTADTKNMPTEWITGDFDADTGVWKPATSKNILWAAPLGSQSYGNPVVAGGKAFVGSNNGKGYLKRYPAAIDLGCLLAFDAQNGSFLWQDSSEKLPTGRVHDWPLQGICCAPLVEGDRLWYVSSRGEVKCLDTEGFHDGENDGPFTTEKVPAADEADSVWVFDMMKQLGVSQHNMCSCSVTSAGNLLFVNTSNGVDEGHINLPNPQAPSFLCLDKRDGRLLWADGSPGANVLHGQWSSPAYAEIDGVPQVFFGGGDGWLYAFDARGEKGASKMLWQFDCNPKESKYTLGGRADRNHIIGTPVVHEGLVYIAVGEDPEHGEGVGHLWCIDPTKRGDTSPELAVSLKDPSTPLPHRRNQAIIKENGEVARPNPNSAAIWHYPGFDLDTNGKLDFEETMHRTCGTVAIKDGLLFVADFSGLFHCLDLQSGKPHWTHDMLAASWGSPLIADGKVYIGDEDGDVSIFALSKEKKMLAEINMGNSVYSTPIVAGETLYIANKSHLFAIRQGAVPAP
ncbi:MAG: serine/threonine protein kinase [Planctomycetota bacterium]|jgi:outer membrane protein assembly factor BamB|nr:PQQ-binding-like beta-propeller repeat protein [Planctomycetia bacterium]RLS66557.1 MAG: serine/threonine protein kinase [Planctomycetota bacterium]